MPAGARDQLIRFQYRVRTPDGGGGYEATWTNRHTVAVRATVDPHGGGETIEGEQAEGRAGYSVTIPNLRDIELSDRIVWVSGGNKILNIRDLGEQGPRPRERTLQAEDAPELEGA